MFSVKKTQEYWTWGTNPFQIELLNVLVPVESYRMQYIKLKRSSARSWKSKNQRQRTNRCMHALLKYVVPFVLYWIELIFFCAWYRKQRTGTGIWRRNGPRARDLRVTFLIALVASHLLHHETFCWRHRLFIFFRFPSDCPSRSLSRYRLGSKNEMVRAEIIRYIFPFCPFDRIYL